MVTLITQVMDEDRERCARPGVSGFIKKPIDLDEFVEEVGWALRKTV